MRRLFVVLTLVMMLLAPSAGALSEVSLADIVVRHALSCVGIRYRFAGDGVHGLDCAGLVRRTFSFIGIRLPRTTTEQYQSGRGIDRAQLRAGDLVFFENTYRPGISHVGIYIGDGRFVHAASTPKRVRVDRLDSDYYVKRYAGARRVM
ncbi:MAG TPA: NlpC/P60 family protein [Thermoanaerobaculia bacterium]|jgi:cell wall-associated NlpC family hydrolase